MDTDFAPLLFHTLIYFTPKGEGAGKATNFISMTQEIDLSSPTFGSSGADPLKHSKY